MTSRDNFTTMRLDYKHRKKELRQDSNYHLKFTMNRIIKNTKDTKLRFSIRTPTLVSYFLPTLFPTTSKNSKNLFQYYYNTFPFLFFSPKSFLPCSWVFPKKIPLLSETKEIIYRRKLGLEFWEEKGQNRMNGGPLPEFKSQLSPK